jgi:4-hydroxybenzoate polyprenyltransferase
VDDSVAVAHLERRTGARSLVTALRPLQWTKNLLLFAGVVFAAKLGDADRWVEALIAFASYCAASSGAYLVNDVRDQDVDRLHPAKRLRPIAAGEVLPGTALRTAAALMAGAGGLILLLGWRSLVLLAAFGALQVAYSLALKHVVLVDVIVISGLFVLRAAAGAAAVDVRISPWLLLCTGLLALFLALGKRRGELALVEEREGSGRRVLAGYSTALLDQLIAIVAASTIVSYALYTFTARDSTALMATIPFVVFGVFRYLLLLHRQERAEEPERLLVTDRPILVTVALWSATCAALLAA